MNKRLNPEPTPLEEKLRYHRRLGHIVPPRKIIKTPEQIEGIRRSALINTAVLDHVAAHIHEGISTEEIDTLVYDFTLSHGAIPAPLHYEGFPKSVCTSINDEVCHGIPDKNIRLQDGDIINVDVSTILNGYFSDASRMFMIGNVPSLSEIGRRHPRMPGIGNKGRPSLGISGRYRRSHTKKCRKPWLFCCPGFLRTRGRTRFPRKTRSRTCR